jgi:cytochrome c biogenesis protein CcmG/thiol:disulfide interchange protein DsbE
LVRSVLKTPKWSKKLGRQVEILVWVGVLGFLIYRLGPQVGAALGIGAGDSEVSGGVVRTLDGDSFTLDDLKGQVVLVNAWATWCPPCVIEMPGFQRVYQDYKDQGFLILGVSRDQGDPAQVRAFLKEKGITYPVAMAADADLGGLTDVATLPTSFLIDREGKIRHTVESLFVGPALRMAVRKLLDEGG